MLKDTLKTDVVAALKNHDSKRVGVLRFLISLIDKKELQMPVDSMKEEDQVAVVRKELKNKEEAREMFAKGGRDDLVEELNYEIEVVKKYLPAEMDEAEIKKLVKEVVVEIGTSNMGMIIGNVIKKCGGRVGGDVVSRIVKEVINEK